jgi:hypothetical protein
MTFLQDELGPRWTELRDELAPYIGERVVALLAFTLAEASGSEALASHFRQALVEDGENPDDPQVTEAEQLLIDWSRIVATDPSAVSAELSARLESTFRPRLREVLRAFADETLAADA